MQKNLSKVILILLSVSAAFLFYKKISTTELQSTAEEQIPLLENQLPEDFHKFYDHFHSDSLYQLEHIIWPLKGLGRDRIDSTDVPIEKQWTPEDWILHRPFNAMGVFERSFVNLNGIVTEIISGQGGLFQMVKRYSKLNGEWFLIYYQELIMMPTEEKMINAG